MRKTKSATTELNGHKRMDDFEVLITIQLASYIGRGESISDESIEPNCSAINNIPPKGVSFSDFIVTFAMSVGFDTYFDLQH